jgi:hypothetical protein
MLASGVHRPDCLRDDESGFHVSATPANFPIADSHMESEFARKPVNTGFWCVWGFGNGHFHKRNGVDREEMSISREYLCISTEYLRVSREYLGISTEEMSISTEYLGISREEMVRDREEMGISRKEMVRDRKEMRISRVEMVAEVWKWGFLFCP